MGMPVLFVVRGPVGRQIVIFHWKKKCRDWRFLRIHTVYEENNNQVFYQWKVWLHLQTKKAGLNSLISLGLDLLQFAPHIHIHIIHNIQQQENNNRTTSKFLRYKWVVFWQVEIKSAKYFVFVN